MPRPGGSVSGTGPAAAPAVAGWGERESMWEGVMEGGREREGWRGEGGESEGERQRKREGDRVNR